MFIINHGQNVRITKRNIISSAKNRRVAGSVRYYIL